MISRRMHCSLAFNLMGAMHPTNLNECIAPEKPENKSLQEFYLSGKDQCSNEYYIVLEYECTPQILQPEFLTILNFKYIKSWISIPISWISIN
jgi:hypothetical protein